jgi:hypothetical protein
MVGIYPLWEARKGIWGVSLPLLLEQKLKLINQICTAVAADIRGRTRKD